jgi:ribonuclease E
MSRQRIRSSVLESSTENCPVCGGTGHVRSVSSVALQLLRAIEETLIKGATHNLSVRTRSEVALYVLNHKRAHLRALEERFRITITVSADATVTGQVSYVIDRGEQVHSPDAARAIAAEAQTQPTLAVEDDEDDLGLPEETAEDTEEVEETGAAEARGEAEGEGETDNEAQGEREGGEPRRRRRRRGRGRGRGGEDREARETAPAQFTQETAAEQTIAHEDHEAGAPEEDAGEEGESREGVTASNGNGEDQDGRRRRRRGRRGGRRNRHRNGEGQEGNGHEAGAEHAAPFEEGVHETSEGAPHPVLSDEDAMAMAPSFPQPTPVHAEAAPASTVHAMEPMPDQPPRRRSTIREAAPVAAPREAAPPLPVSQPAHSTSEPVVSSTSGETAAPKRGWWGRKLLGDK